MSRIFSIGPSFYIIMEKIKYEKYTKIFPFVDMKLRPKHKI